MPSTLLVTLPLVLPASAPGTATDREHGPGEQGELCHTMINPPELPDKLT
jgi:hypothetical protein